MQSFWKKVEIPSIFFRQIAVKFDNILITVEFFSIPSCHGDGSHDNLPVTKETVLPTTFHKIVVNRTVPMTTRVQRKGAVKQ